MWVNGEKYVFSQHVLDGGIALFKTFNDIKEKISQVYNWIKDGHVET